MVQPILVPRDDFSQSGNLDHFELHPTFPVHDRSSAHFAGWHCIKRAEPRVTQMGTHKVGDRFKLDDARVWMRLHFWACRETGLFAGGRAWMQQGKCETATPLQLEFENWYERFIGHFMRVYERSAPAFARVDSAWSDLRTEAGHKNIADYLEVQAVPDYFEKGRHGMEDIVGQRNAREARAVAGLSAVDDGWPYNDSGEFVDCKCDGGESDRCGN